MAQLIKDLLDDYCVLDLETTGLSVYYNEIIEVGILKVRNNKIIDKYEQLIKPEYYINEFISDLTGITNEMVKDSPSIEEVENDIIKFIGNDIILGHNTKFDIKFLNYNIGIFIEKYIDTLSFAKKIYKDLENYKLSTISEYLNLSNNEHRSIADCITTKELYDKIKEYISNQNIDIKNLFSYKYKIQNFKAKDIISNKDEFDTEHLFFDKNICITGVLEKMSRKQAMQIIADLGGHPQDSITKITNFLVLGNNEYCSSIKDGKSNKQKKAEEYKLKGQDIEIICERTFYDIINE